MRRGLAGALVTGALLVALAPSASAQQTSCDPFTQPSFRGDVPTAQQVIGINLGDRDVTAAESDKYLLAVDAASTRVTSGVAATSVQGRPLRYAIAGTLTFATGIAMGYRPGGGVLGVVGAVLLGVVAGWSLAWIFTWFGTVGRSAQGVQGISLMVMFPLTFLSNAFVPTRTMPGWLEAFANVNPVSHVISAMRGLANHGTVNADLGWALLGFAVIVAVFAPLSVRRFSRKM